MVIELRENQPEVVFRITSSEGKFVEQKFLIDTGFSGNCVFILSENSHQYYFFDIEELPRSQWIMAGDGRRIKTYKAKIVILFGERPEEVDARILEADRTDIPIIGIDFLKQNQKKLVLDFKNEHYELV